METIGSSAIEWGCASRALPGEATSGDLQVVKPFPGGVLIAVLDGVGHGSEAAAAAAMAGAILENHAADLVIELVRRCHEALRATRGVTMSVASLNVAERSLAWLAVGNVEGVLLRQSGADAMAEESLLLRPGVVGLRLPALEAEVVRISDGDLLIFTTDGVRSVFTRGLARSKVSPQRTACGIRTKRREEST